MNQVQRIFDFIPSGNTLSKILLYFIGSAVLSFIIAPIIIKILYKLDIRRVAKGDIVTQRDQNTGKLGTPIMGGLIVIVSTLIITRLFNWERNFTWLPVGALILSCSVGGIDDLLNTFGADRKQPKPLRLHLKLIRVHKSSWMRLYYLVSTPWAFLKRLFLFLGSKPRAGLQVHEKLLLQAVIGVTVGLWIYSKVGWSDIWIPYILRFEWVREVINILPGIEVKAIVLNDNTIYNSISIGWLMVPFVALTIMTVTNAVNLSDGMDGLSGGLLAIAFLSYVVIAYNFSQTARIFPENLNYRFIAYLAATVSGSLMAYLYFNVKPARVQMADVGALGLGTLLSIIAIVLHREITLLFIAAVFLFDGIFARIIQKAGKVFLGRKIFKIIPVHYHFEMLGWPEEKVVMRFWIIGIIFAAIGVWIAGL